MKLHLHKQLMTNCRELEFPIRAELLTSFLCVQSECWIYSISLFRAIIDLIVYIEIHCLLTIERYLFLPPMTEKEWLVK